MVIEIDGGYHQNLEQKEIDGLRTKALAELGLQELRFRNEEVENDFRMVEERILGVLEERI